MGTVFSVRMRLPEYNYWARYEPGARGDEQGSYRSPVAERENRVHAHRVQDRRFQVRVWSDHVWHAATHVRVPECLAGKQPKYSWRLSITVKIASPPREQKTQQYQSLNRLQNYSCWFGTENFYEV